MVDVNKLTPGSLAALGDAMRGKSEADILAPASAMRRLERSERVDHCRLGDGLLGAANQEAWDIITATLSDGKAHSIRKMAIACDSGWKRIKRLLSSNERHVEQIGHSDWVLREID